MRFPVLLGALLLSLPLAAQTTPPAAAPIYTYVEQMPVPPGGIGITLQRIQNHLRYPAEAQQRGVQGKVFVKFVVDAAGQVQQAAVLKGLGAGCDEEALRIIRELPAWTPGKQNGQPVSVYYTLPVAFRLPDDALPVSSPAPAAAPPPDPYPVDEVAHYPGGIAAMQRHLNAAIRYPANARKEGIQGKVFVQFLVDSTGHVQQPKIVRGPHPWLDGEAIRVVKSMATWQPARYRGRPVPMSFTIPVTFSLTRE
jgi:TonB family protein